MRKANIIHRVWDLYYDGFTHMKLGKTLWLVILIKFFIIFFILKLLFFPDFIKMKAKGGDKPEYVSSQITERVQP